MQLSYTVRFDPCPAPGMHCFMYSAWFILPRIDNYHHPGGPGGRCQHLTVCIIHVLYIFTNTFFYKHIFLLGIVLGSDGSQAGPRPMHSIGQGGT